jgi:hypothetical protein
MLRITTRFITGRAVSVGKTVTVGVNVRVGAEVGVDVGVRTGDSVNIGVGVKVRVDNWHAISTASRTAYIMKRRFVFILNDCNTTGALVDQPLENFYKLLTCD